MLLPRRGEFFYMGRCQRLMGFAVSEGRWVRCGEIENGMVWGVNALINLPLKRYGVFHVPLRSSMKTSPYLKQKPHRHMFPCRKKILVYVGISRHNFLTTMASNDL